jgi:prephenate dehydrogenase
MGSGLPSPSRVSVVGLGLIGRSLASALRQRLPPLHITGIDRETTLPQGLGPGLVDDFFGAQDTASIARAFADSHVIFIATPVSAIPPWLALALAHPALVIDCGSSKREIARAAHALPGAERFVPGHPMAGAGADRAATRADLFEGRSWVLCPERCDPLAFAAAEALVRRLGARPVRMNADAHDRAVAWTSHVPRIVASALLALAGREGALPAAGPAFERLSRGAGGSIEMWGDVLSSNSDEVARALRALVSELQACAGELERGSLGQLLLLLSEADRAREGLERAAQGSSKI